MTSRLKFQEPTFIELQSYKHCFEENLHKLKVLYKTIKDKSTRNIAKLGA